LRACNICGLKGHYLTMCLLNPNRSRVAEKKGVTNDGVKKRERPITHCTTKDVGECVEEQYTIESNEDDYDESE
jgi:hypothetical protein